MGSNPMRSTTAAPTRKPADIETCGPLRGRLTPSLDSTPHRAQTGQYRERLLVGRTMDVGVSCNSETDTQSPRSAQSEVKDP
jgi:hypothetical protein